MTRGERLAALFLLGLVAFSPALLRIFGAPVLVSGLPKLLLWTFGAWGGLILLAALTIEYGDKRGSRPEED